MNFCPFDFSTFVGFLSSVSTARACLEKAVVQFSKCGLREGIDYEDVRKPLAVGCRVMESKMPTFGNHLFCFARNRESKIEEMFWRPLL